MSQAETDYQLESTALTGAADSPTQALIRAYWDELRPAAQRLQDSGWNVSPTVRRHDDERVTFDLECELRPARSAGVDR